MKFDTTTTKVHRFLAQYPDLPRSEDGVFIFIGEDELSTLQVLIHVNERATVVSLRKASSLANVWRKNIIAFQGRTDFATEFKLLNLVEKDTRSNEWSKLLHLLGPKVFEMGDRFTYAQVAKGISDLICDWLYEFLGKSNQHLEIKGYRLILEIYTMEIGSVEPSNKKVKSEKLLVLFGTKPNVAMEIVSTAIETIRTGKRPFQNRLAISKELVKLAISNYRKSM